MEVTVEQLLNGKGTRIGKRDYFPTRAYVEPFLERMSKLTSDFRVQVKLPEQITRTVDDEINIDDITFNRVWIQAVMPEECSFDNHDEVIGLLYGLDARTPVAKIYRGGLNRACTNLCIFEPEFLDVQKLEPETALNYKPVTRLMEQTSDMKLMLKTLHETEWSRDVPTIESKLGSWVRNTINCSYDEGYGKIKLGTEEVIKAYKSLFVDNESPYYVNESNDVSMFTVYNAFTELISNDKGKDIINKVEKTLLLRNILGF